jgi:hypothetical protein
MLLDFGKHKGKSIEDTPLSYIIFLAGYRMIHHKKERCELSGCKWVKEKKPAVHAFANEYLLSRCWHCGGKLVPVGSSRANGASHDDWDGRYLHKKCWLELKSQTDDCGDSSDESE